MITLIGNSSASLDPKQIPNDGNDNLLLAADAFALGRTRGLSDEQTMTAVEVGAEMGMKPEQAIREVSRSQRAQVRAALGAAQVVDPTAQLRQTAAQLGTVPSVPEPRSIDFSVIEPADSDQTLRPGRS